MNGRDELGADDVAREFPDWRISRGICGLWYAHLPDSEPPLMSRGEDPTDLRDEIRRKLAQVELSRYLSPRDPDTSRE